METASSKKIRLIQMQSRQEGLTMLYNLEFSDSMDSWTVTRRYSQLRRCHVKLLELFDVSELPHFPPKEPIFQKLLGNKKHSEFVQNRELELQNYVLGLLEDEKMQQTLPVQELLSMPAVTVPESSDSFALSAFDDEGELGIAAFSGFRVRLTGEPGGLEVIVRAGTHSDLSLRPSRVDLTLQELTEEEGENPLSENRSASRSASPDPDRAALQRLEEVLDFEEDRASKRFSLRPGSFWEVSARGVTDAGIAGSAVFVRVRAPGEKELANLPESALQTVERRVAAEANSSCPQEAAAQEGDLPVRESGAKLPDVSQQETQPQELEVQQEAADVDSICPTVEDELPPGELETKKPDLPAQESSQGHELHKDLEKEPAQELEVQQEASSLTADVSSSGSCGASVRAAREGESSEGKLDSGLPVAVEQQSEAKEQKKLEKESMGEMKVEQRVPPILVAKTCENSEQEDVPSPGTPLRQRFETAPDGRENFARSFAPRRRLETAEEDHRVLFARGNVAAAYMQNVQEKQQMAIEKAPHRFEKVNGAVSSVPLKFSAIGAAPNQGTLRLREEAQVLDQKRHEQEMRELQENEQKAARWIYAVTGHPDMGDAVAGKITFQAAIQSGEALCDLINAVWPGRITGILRGEVKKLRRVENAQKFCRVCKEVGVDDAHIFAPAELAVGKNDRSVLLCLFDLSAVIPEPPEYEGPRIGDNFDSPASSEFNED